MIDLNLDTPHVAVAIAMAAVTFWLAGGVRYVVALVITAVLLGVLFLRRPK